MQRLVPDSLLTGVATAWLGSDFVHEVADAHQPGSLRFNATECGDFARYLTAACRFTPTHGIPKFPYQLVLELGLRQRTLCPGVEVELLPRRFPGEACARLDANRKLGVSVMLEIIRDAPAKVEHYGRFEWLVDGAAHFGFGGYYADVLADLGYVVEIRNTALRGDEVFPWGADTTRPECARMGTDPVTWAFPTRGFLGFNFRPDFALSSIAFGTLGLRRLLNISLEPGTAVDEAGAPTTDPQKARRLLFRDHRSYALALVMEAIAAMMNGGNMPWHRSVSIDGAPGGASNWVVSVASPDYFRIKGDDPVAHMAEVLAGIVRDNGAARLPGESTRHEAGADLSNIRMEGAVFDHLVKMAEQAGVALDPAQCPIV